MASPLQHIASNDCTITMTLRREIHVISDLSALAKLREVWDRLAADAENCRSYITYPYCELVAEKLFSSGGRLCVVMLYDNGRDVLTALWPLAITRRGAWRVATRLTCGTGEEYGYPLLRMELPQLVDAMVDAARHVPADVLEVSHIENDSDLQRSLVRYATPRLLPESIGQEAAFAINLRQYSDVEDYYKNVVSTKTKQNLRRQAKNLKEQHGHVDIGWCVNAAEATSVVRWLFDSKRSWAQARGITTDWLIDPSRAVENFFLTLAERHDHSTPLVCYIKLNGTPIAAGILWVGKQVNEWCLTTFDETYHRYGLGTLLMDFLVRWSHAHHLDLDFRYFESEYKARWANVQTAQKTRYVFLNPFGRLMEGRLVAGKVVGRLVVEQGKLRAKLKQKLFRSADRDSQGTQLRE